MLGTLTEKFRNLTSRLLGQKQLTKENIAEAVQQVRTALLDADVHFSIVNPFIQRVKEKALGETVLKSVASVTPPVTPGEQFIEILHAELTKLMGAQEAPLLFPQKPLVVMLCGLQGSGKTTTAAKLGHFLRKKPFEKKVMLAACDLQRPAAIEQLQTLGASVQIPVWSLPGAKSPVEVAKKALEQAQAQGFDVLIVDTAGRLTVDTELMQELQEIKEAIHPHETLFVASSHTGHDAVTTAQAFDQKISTTGTVLTMLDGTARAGAALSIREATQKPLKFEGIGEKIDDFQPFNPASMADRILGMGDVVNLVRRAKEVFQEEEQKELEKKLLKGAFTYEDYLKQMTTFKRMGPLKGLLQMLPGAVQTGALQMPNLDHSEEELKKIEAIILSMTPRERLEKEELVPSRRWRLAKGSGRSLEDVNRLIKGFKRVKELMKRLPKSALQNSDFLKKSNHFIR